MSDPLPYWAHKVTVTENVVYVGTDGWEPDPLEMAKTLACSELIMRNEEKREKDS